MIRPLPHFRFAARQSWLGVALTSRLITLSGSDGLFRHR